MISSQFQAYLASNPWSSPYGTPSELVSFKFLPDTRTLVFVMRGGEIATAPLEDEPVIVNGLSPLQTQSQFSSLLQVEVVGNIDAGILAASWSPDESLLVLATGMLVFSCNDTKHDTWFPNFQAMINSSS